MRESLSFRSLGREDLASCKPVRVTEVVIAHDYLTQRGGAERVVLALLEAFPGSRVVTSVFAPDRTFPEFRGFEIETILPAAGAFGRDARFAFPLLAPAFSRHLVDDADVVVCSSSGWAHGIGATAPKVVYCHTPARWLYLTGDYVAGHGPVVRAVAAAARAPLRRWDARAAASAASYVANSTVVRDRIAQVYGRAAEVVHPPAALDPDGLQRPVAVGDAPFLLTVGRPRGYKNLAVVEAAARAAGVPLIAATGGLDDAQLRWLYANCRGLVAAAHEDFGLTPVEAMSFGKPVLALRAGGYLDSVAEGSTGVFFDRLDVGGLAEALATFDETAFDPAVIKRHAELFSRERFVSRMREIVAAA
ncbi:MAG TPA: glycosyltransferase [Gaiellaceae bacterium]|nr:glycosyltransferase [Gaiellaceae bacterium]